MRILFYIYPGILPLGPSFTSGWTSLLAELCTTLVTNGAGDYCFVTGERFRHLVTGLPDVVKTGFVDEVALHTTIASRVSVASAPSSLAWLADHEQDCSHPALAVVAEYIQAASGMFQPDIVITFSLQAHYLKSIWPDAVIMHVETGAFSRQPYSFSLFFDHLGMYRSSAPSRLPLSGIEGILQQDSFDTLRQFRSWSNTVLARENPFAFHDLKYKYDHLVLLPLQVSGYHSFGEHTHHQTQFEYLFDFLGQTPPEIGVIATEYVQWGHVIEESGPSENIGLLKNRFPNLHVNPVYRKFLSSSQYLVPTVDGVWTVVSNLGYQALLAGKRLGTSSRSYLANAAHDHTPSHFFEGLARQPDDQEVFLAWYLQYYLVPDAVLKDGGLLYDYLERRLEAIRSSDDITEQFVTVASDAVMRNAWTPDVTDSVAVSYVTPHNRQLHRRVVADAVLAEMQTASDKILPEITAVPPECEAGRYILLNATDVRERGLHLGCNVTNRLLKENFATAGLRLHGVANSAAECHALMTLSGFQDVTLIVMNGEGSTHHDCGRCKELLDFCAVMKTRGCCCVLINSEWHENTAILCDYLNIFGLVSVRESISLQAIRRWRSDARRVPDFSFAAFLQNLSGFIAEPRAPVIMAELAVIDHVQASVARSLHDFAEYHHFPCFLMGPSHLDALVKTSASGYEVSGEVFPAVLRDYAELKGAKGCLTGRFHGLTAALACGIPTVCLPATTPVIEGTLNDFGLSDISLLPQEWLEHGYNKRLDAVETLLAKWDSRVMTSVQENVDKAHGEIRQLFDDIKRLVSP